MVNERRLCWDISVPPHPIEDRSSRDIKRPKLHPKATVASMVYRTRLFDHADWGAKGRLVIFNYHRIRARHDSISLFDNGVFGPAVDVFEEQVAWLSSHTRILTEDELMAAVRTGRLPARRCSMITFDDGYRDNYDLAWPILRQYGAPATFFIVSGLTESHTLGWWDLIAYLIKQCELPQIRFGSETFPLDPHDRTSVIAAFLEKITGPEGLPTRELVVRLSEACGVDIPHATRQADELMDWDQVREVANNGISIGSHTHSHPILSRLSEVDQMRELAESRNMLESKLRLPVRSVAYPVGNYECFTEQTKGLSKDCGYKLGYSFATGTNDWPCDNFDIRRISAPVQLPFFAAKASFPLVFGGQ